MTYKYTISTAYKPRVTHALSLLTLAMFSSFSHADTPFDIRVSYYDTSANANARKTGIEENINNFAEALYEATNGAHRLRNVTIYAGGTFKDDTDILWVKDCHPNANTNGRNNRGSRIEHCDQFNGSSFLSNFVSGGHVLTHEWAHFTYALLDEYQDDKTACSTDKGSPCKNDTPVENSIMNSQWNASENNALIESKLAWLNFSTASNNTKNTAQHRVFGLSGWELLSRDSALDPEETVSELNNRRRVYYTDLATVAPGAGSVPAIEINTVEGRTKAKSLLNFIWKTTADAPITKSLLSKANTESSALSVAKQIVIERSSNISASMLEEVKAAVQQIVEQANVGDTLGVIAFDTHATVIIPPTKIVSEASKTTLMNAIQTIQLNAQPAALGDALKTAISTLKAANLPSNSVSAIYLFADGFSPVGTAPLSQIDSLQKEGLTLFSFGSNNDVAVNTLLRQLAQKTRGEHYLAVKNNVLVKAIQQTEERISPVVDVIIAQDSLSLSNGQNLPFYVDSTIADLEVVVSYSGSAAGTHFSVIDPQSKSTPISQSTCVSEAGEDVNSNSNFCTLKLQGVVEGNWKIQLTTANAEPITIFYSVSGDPKDNNAALSASVNSNNPITSVGSNVVLTAKIAQEFPITDITVTSKLEKPDGSSVALDWRDDGVKPDYKVRDGIYTATFNVPVEGSYFTTVNFDNLANSGQVTNSGATYAAASNAGPGSFFQPLNVKFTRVAETEIVATQVAAGNTGISDYERVMNWGEAVVAPAILPVKGKQSLDIAPYKVRYYPQTKTYLGYNPLDGNMYIYNPDIYGKEVLLLGPLSGYLTAAKQDGF
ncbi:MAG: VWA domain-containing protein [Methylococcaceae bacterium]